MFNEIDSCFARWMAWMIIGFIIISVITAILGFVENTVNAISGFLKNIGDQIAKILQMISDFFRDLFGPRNGERTPSPDEPIPSTPIAGKPTVTSTCDGSHCKTLTYTVRSGDTLWKIAQEFNMEWEKIRDENKDNCSYLQDNPGSLKIGWVLCIPGAPEGDPSPTPGPGPSDTVTPTSDVRPWHDPASFISYVASFAQKEMRDSGVPASFSIAQAACETGWQSATSTLAVDYNNYHGIKCSGPNEGLDCISLSGDTWNQYSSTSYGFLWHGRWLHGNPRYANAWHGSLFCDPCQRYLWLW